MKLIQNMFSGLFFHYICEFTTSENTYLVPVSQSISSLRFSEVPYSLYGTYENLRLKMLSKTDTCFFLPLYNLDNRPLPVRQSLVDSLKYCLFPARDELGEGRSVVRWCWVNFQCRGVLLILIIVWEGLLRLP